MLWKEKHSHPHPYTLINFIWRTNIECPLSKSFLWSSIAVARMFSVSVAFSFFHFFVQWIYSINGIADVFVDDIKIVFVPSAHDRASKGYIYCLQQFWLLITKRHDSRHCNLPLYGSSRPQNGTVLFHVDWGHSRIIMSVHRSTGYFYLLRWSEGG